MSPEQAKGEEVDARTDLFSLGTVLFEAATQSPPFQGVSLAALFDNILHHTPPSLTQLRPDIPPDFAHLVSKLLEQDRQLRYQSAAEVVGDVKRLQRASKSPLSTTVPTPTRRRGLGRRWIAILGAALVALLLAAFWASRYRIAPQSNGLAQTTVAVLPFQNVGDDKSYDFLRLADPG